MLSKKTLRRLHFPSAPLAHRPGYWPIWAEQTSLVQGSGWAWDDDPGSALVPTAPGHTDRLFQAGKLGQRGRRFPRFM